MSFQASDASSELSSTINHLSDGWPVPEILAPAGGRAQFFAALQAGADAVFLGLKNFNARGRAENFSIDDLRELMPLARFAGMKVLVTMNILLKEAELPLVIEELTELQTLGIEALIIQDIGLARLLREQFPHLRLHASTQLAVHNKVGVLAAAALGFRRVVLARELTAQELRKIRREVPRDLIEIEAFCHGSLCYSYSGLCFFSGAEDARSGNRGECAYTCRKPYQIHNEPGHGFLFSMKDLDTSLDLEKLVHAGVDTLKIEGRKKDAQYVATTVGLYRQELNRLFGRETGRRPQTDVDGRDYRRDMAFSFHRETTSFFVKGRYHENVIDLSNPTHKGLAIGTIDAVHGRSMEMTTSESLERYDGLRIDRQESLYHAKPQHGQDVKAKLRSSQQKYANEVQQFSLREFYVSGSKVTSCPAGSRVRIQLPDEGPLPKAGDQVFKTRSNELKRHTETMAQAPDGARLRPLSLIDLSIHVTALNADQLELKATATLGGHALAQLKQTIAGQKPEKEATLERDLIDLMHIFGDAQIETALSLTGDLNWFVPKRLLKNVKQTLGQALTAGLEQAKQSIQAQALASLTHARRPWRALSDGVYHQIKIDRLDYLPTLAAYFDRNPDFAVDELVFEPKRAFLHDLKAPAFFATLFEFCALHRLSLRFALPTVMRAWDEPLLKSWVLAFHAQGGLAFEVGNIGATVFLSGLGIDLSGCDLSSDFTLYGLNTVAIEAMRDLGIQRYALSVEDDRSSLYDKLDQWPLAAGAPQVILYKDTPLFIAEACSLTALHHGCPGSQVCGYRTLEISNEDGEKFFVAHETCKSIVYGAEAFSWTQHKAELVERGIRHFRIDFLTRPYQASDMERILDAMHRGHTLPQTQNANFSRVFL